LENAQIESRSYLAQPQSAKAETFQLLL